MRDQTAIHRRSKRIRALHRRAPLAKLSAALLWAVLIASLLVVPAPARAGMPGSGGGNPGTSDPPGGLLPPGLPPGGREALCLLRDESLGNAHWLFQKLGLGNLFKNYYCDGGCFMCCKIPGTTACHTSFDYSDYGTPPINCDPSIYGSGTTIVGEALIYGDPLGLGICAGGVQQLCTHLPVCNGDGGGPPSAASADGPGAGAGSAAGSGGEPGAGGLDDLAASMSLEAMSGSLPPHPDMSEPGAMGSRAKAFAKAILHNFTNDVRSRPPGLPFREYVDFATARGALNWRSAMSGVEPYDGNFDVFRVEDDDGELLPDESYQLGILFHANLALLGSVPNLLERLGYVEARYWTEQEKDAYLNGVDPETELRKTMGPVALEALKQVPIQDWRLLAVPAPSESPLAGRSFEGFELGRAPIVSAAIDCGPPDEVTLALHIDDPEQAVAPDSFYPVIVNWGDGTFTRHTYDSTLPHNVVSHAYADPGSYLAYVTASNVTGLRGVAGIVVENTAVHAASDPAALARLELDDFDAYGPALISAGDLSFDIEVRRPDGTSVVAGWSENRTLANAGATPLSGIVAYNEALTPIDAIVLRPNRAGGYFYDSVYFQSSSITLGFFDPQLGSVVTRTVPMTDDLLKVYYVGATDPVPPELLERDINGDLIFPAERENAALPANFCGGPACEIVDRIEIPITPDLLAERPASNPAVPASLSVGDVARWLEDTPGTFIANIDLTSTVVEGSCAGSISVDFVSADAQASSHVDSLSIDTLDPSVPAGGHVQLQATAILLDGSVIDVTDRVTWTSSAPTVLSVSNGQAKGRLEAGVIPGTATITAALGDVEASTLGTNASPDQGFATYRFLITEIHGSVGRAGLNSVELVVDGSVLENRMVAVDDGTIGPFSATIATAPGSGALGAFDASFGTGWVSPNGTFQTVAPFVVGANPVYLQVSFDQPLPVTDIRLHRQGGILPPSFQPQFPKEVVVQGSNDGFAFETLTTHRIENWDYQPVQIPIPVPEPHLVLQLSSGSVMLAGLTLLGRRRRDVLRRQ